MEKKPLAVVMSTLLCLSISLGLIAFTIPGWFIWNDFRPFETQKHVYFYDYFSLIDLITQNEDMYHDALANTQAKLSEGDIVTSLSWWATNANNLLDNSQQTYFVDMYQFRQEFCDCEGCDIFRDYDSWYDDFCKVCDQWVAGSVATAVITCLFFVFGCIAMFMPVIHVKRSGENFPCKKAIGNGVCLHLAIIFMTIAFIIFTTVLYTISYNFEIDRLQTIAGASVYEGAFSMTWIAYIFYCVAYRPVFHVSEHQPEKLNTNENQ